MAERHDIVAIIPAKSASKRLPEKNIKLFRGLPLFVWSVLYAHEEGVQPVVLTDSELIAHIAAGFGALVYPQTEDQFENHTAILPVLDDLSVKKFGLLQATSPLRKKGLLQEMLDIVPEMCPSCYTAERVKLLGHCNGKFYANKFDKGGDTVFQRHDGNIIACTADYFREHDSYFIGPESFVIPNELPYAVDIDTQEDFDTAEGLALIQPELLVHPIKTIAVVQNQRIIKRDYSEFIDGCDLVVRNGTMDNLNIGRTGKRIDIHFAVAWRTSWIYIDHPEDRHLDKANEAAICFQHDRDDVNRSVYKYSFGYTDQYRGPGKDERVGAFTTKSLAIWHMHYAFPEATIYNLGTHSPTLHSDFGKMGFKPINPHIYSKEQEVLDDFVKRGIVVDILEEDCKTPVGKYSKIPTDGKPLPELLYVRGKDWGAPYYIYPDTMRLVTKDSYGMRWATVENYVPGERLVVCDRGDVNKRIMFLYNKDVKSYDAETIYASISYDHIFVLGENCAATHFARNYLQRENGYGPFEWAHMQDLGSVLELIYKRGEHTADIEDLCRTKAPDGKYVVWNKKTGQVFMHHLPETSEATPLTQEEIEELQAKNQRRWDRMLGILDSPDAKVLFIYADFGNGYRTKFPRLEMFHKKMPFDFPADRLQIAMRNLKQQFKADISFLYVEPAQDGDPPRILYRDTNILACTHTCLVNKKTAEMADDLYKAIMPYINAALCYVGVSNIDVLLHVHHRSWKDKLTIYKREKRGYKGDAAWDDTFTVLEYEPEKILRLHWDIWARTETFKKDGAFWEFTGM